MSPPPSVRVADVPHPVRPADPRGTVRIQVDPTFVPCPVEDGDERFSNGTFVSSATRIFERVARHPE